MIASSTNKINIIELHYKTNILSYISRNTPT